MSTAPENAIGKNDKQMSYGIETRQNRDKSLVRIAYFSIGLSNSGVEINISSMPITILFALSPLCFEI